MNSSWQDRLRETQAALESRDTELKRELDQVQKAREAINELLSTIDGGNPSPSATVAMVPAATQERASALSKKRAPTRSVLPNGLTRRRAVWQIIPEFEGSTFAPRDIREKYIERYPQDNHQNLPPTISSLLRDMAERGEIERVGRGKKATDPTIYRAKESNEENP